MGSEMCIRDREKQVQTEERRMSGKGIYCDGVAGMAHIDAEALQQMCANWDSLLSQLRVGGSLDGHLPSERVERKQHQITNMMFFVAIFTSRSRCATPTGERGKVYAS